MSNLIKTQTTKQNNQIAKFNEKGIKCYDVLTLNFPINTLIVPQLKPVCKFKKKKGDKALPITKLPLKDRYIATLGRADLPCKEQIKEQRYKTMKDFSEITVLDEGKK